MFNETYELNISGTLSGPDAPKRHASVNAVVLFIKKNLTLFSIKMATTEIKNEKGLTQELVQTLNPAAINGSYPFWFEKEYMEKPENGNSPSIDIGTLSLEDDDQMIHSKHSGNRSFFSIEAKRLPTPGAGREKEYVIGSKKNGGIERFKIGKHGSHLKHGGMIGFIQKNSVEYWNKKINEWILELTRKNNKSDIT